MNTRTESLIEAIAQAEYNYYYADNEWDKLDAEFKEPYRNMARVSLRSAKDAGMVFKGPKLVVNGIDNACAYEEIEL